MNPDPELRLTPERGNVAFASTDMAWCFTLRSFAQMYADSFGLLLQSASPLLELKDSRKVPLMFAAQLVPVVICNDHTMDKVCAGRHDPHTGWTA